MQINPLKQLYTDLMKIVSSSEVKYKVLADKYETIETKKSADAFIKASRGEDSFDTYYRYDMNLIAEVCNTTDEDVIESYHYDRKLIPYEYRDLLLRKTRAKIISEYVETNNYYRCLLGLPDIEESEADFIYVADEYLSTLGLDTTVPIHELTDMQLSILYSVGEIDKLKEKYPKKKYLRYLGANKIDLITARTAKNFSLLSIPYNISESLWNTFSLIYEQSREYFCTCVYITEYRQIFDFYDNFIALCIMVMAIQQVFARTIKSTIDREFFDDYSVKLLFDVYGVPYNQNMASDIRKQIVQSLNTLVLNKGTNKVLFDIASILGYDRLQIYKYYIMRSQRYDKDGVPVEIYKKDEITGENVLDYKAMYDVYFQKVLIDDNDAYKAIMDERNRVPYHEVVEDDPYWLDDASLQEELYQSEYNYVESKYMGVSISYRMTRILFENIYLLRMILDKKDEIPYITIDIPKVSTYNSVPLFDAIVYLCALTCKQNHLKGEILTKPSMILHVMGFDFNNDFNAIREEILNDPNIDDSLASLIEDTSCLTAEKLNNVYKNLLSFYDILVEKMSTTQNIDAYHSYMKLYKTIFYSKENQTMFNIGTAENPVYASTFMEYIQHTNPDVYEFIESLDEDTLYVYANHIASKVLSVIPDLKYLGFFADSSSTMEAMLVELIRFFKSYTTDMIGMDIVFIFDLKPETMIRLIEHVTIHKTIQPEDKLLLSYSDSLNFTSTVRYSSDLMMRDKVHNITSWVNMWDNLYFLDKLRIYSSLDVSSELSYMDTIHNLYDAIYLESSLLYSEMAKIYSNHYIDSKLSFEDFCKILIKESVSTGMNLFGVIYIHNSIDLKDDSIDLDDDAMLHGKNSIETKLLLYDLTSFKEKSKIQDEFSLFDTSYFYNSIETNDVINMTDKFKSIVVKAFSYDNITFTDSLHQLIAILTEKTNLSLNVVLSAIVNIIETDKLLLRDVHNLTSYIALRDTILLYDAMAISSTIMTKSNLDLGEFISMMSSMDEKDIICLIDSCNLKTILYWADNLNLKNKLSSIVKEIFSRDKMVMKDVVSLIIRFKENESIILSDRYVMKCNILGRDVIQNMDTITSISKSSMIGDTYLPFDDISTYISIGVNDKFKLNDTCNISFI